MAAVSRLPNWRCYQKSGKAEIGSARDRGSSARRDAFSSRVYGSRSYRMTDSWCKVFRPHGHRSELCVGGSGHRPRNLSNIGQQTCKLQQFSHQVSGYGMMNVETIYTMWWRVVGCLTLFALAHPIAWERRGSVIVGGGHGRRTIGIILCAVRPRLCILFCQNLPICSRHHAQ